MNKKLKHKLINLLPYRTKYWLEKFKLLLKAPKLALQFNHHNAAFKHAIVIISFPRSGSSWVGSILGAAENTLYLREPVTTSFMLKKQHRLSVFSPEKCANWPMYQQYINQAFLGKSSRLNSIYKYPEQWLTETTNKSLVIKEVNPLVIEHYQQQANKLIYLLRHPYSVAKSYAALNWQAQNLFNNRFGFEELQLIQAGNTHLFNASYWYQMGYLLGWIEAKTKNTLIENSSITIRYEDICQQPQLKFEQLFKHAELTFNETIKANIGRTLSAQTNSTVGEFSLERKQNDVAFVRVKTTDKPDYTELMTAYTKAIVDYNQVNNCQHYGEYQINCQLIQWY